MGGGGGSICICVMYICVYTCMYGFYLAAITILTLMSFHQEAIVTPTKPQQKHDIPQVPYEQPRNTEGAGQDVAS